MPRLVNALLLSMLVLLGCVRAQAQVGKAIGRMESGKWSSAEQILVKAIKKDSLDVEARVLYSRYFFIDKNPKHDLDSARALVNKAAGIYAGLQDKQRERLTRSGIDSASIMLLWRQIDSAAFEQAKGGNTVASYESFISRFPEAPQLELAKELRNEVAFLEALRVNTPQAFSAYLERYPDSRRATEVKERYDLLVFQEITSDGKLTSFQKFVSVHPHSAHRGQAEKRIFEMSTASGQPEAFRQFVAQYPSSPYADRARNILYYLSAPGVRQLASDSLARLEKINSGYWVPFFKNGLYGFIDEDGNETIPPRFAGIDSTYLCGNIREDVLLTSEGLFSRAGHRLLNEKPDKAVQIGPGFLLVTTHGCAAVIHKSGFGVGPSCVTDAHMVSDQFVAINSQGKWKLYAFNGLLLASDEFEDIAFEDNIIILTRSGKKILTTADQWTTAAEGVSINLSLVFDEVRAWGDGNLVVRNGALEGLINQQLEFIIPLDRQTLTKTTSGFIRSKDGGKSVVGIIPELEQQTFDNVIDYGGWMVLEKGKKATLYRAATRTVAARELDSVWLQNKVPFAKRRDSVIVFGSGRLATFENSAPLTFLKSRDTSVYYWVQEKKVKSVFEAVTSTKLFSAEFEDIEAIGGGLFIVKQKTKKGPVKLGVAGRDGKFILAPEFDAIIPTSSRYLSLLKDKKFGLYDLSRKLILNATYERNILPYSEKYFIAYRGGYGLINTKEEPVTEFEFDEIRFWNDSSAWVKKGYSWSIYSITDKAMKLSRVRSFQVLSDAKGEMVVRIQQENNFGIASNRHGVIIPATFSEIINVGSPEKPMYFTDKRVEEAEIDVVIYYDHNGKLIRKQVYESDEYEKIYCD